MHVYNVHLHIWVTPLGLCHRSRAILKRIYWYNSALRHMTSLHNFSEFNFIELSPNQCNGNGTVYLGHALQYLVKHLCEYYISGNFLVCNFSCFSDFWHFCLFLNSLFFSAILHRPAHKINTFALAQKWAKSTKINVAQKCPLLQYALYFVSQNVQDLCLIGQLLSSVNSLYRV